MCGSVRCGLLLLLLRRSVVVAVTALLGDVIGHMLGVVPHAPDEGGTATGQPRQADEEQPGDEKNDPQHSLPAFRIARVKPDAAALIIKAGLIVLAVFIQQRADRP